MIMKNAEIDHSQERVRNFFRTVKHYQTFYPKWSAIIAFNYNSKSNY